MSPRILYTFAVYISAPAPDEQTLDGYTTRDVERLLQDQLAVRHHARHGAAIDFELMNTEPQPDKP